jgi:UDP-N-acetylmuramoyl-L-alanyl-D-glutamate--2,6-diaminopimelate ligase
VRFSQLLDEIPDIERFGADVDISAICDDSRSVTPGSLFVAVSGYVSDGHRFIAQALASGAAALLTERGQVDVSTMHHPYALASDTRSALARVAANFYGRPASKLRMVGVTGTDGKTTTCHLISAVLEAEGQQTGLIGTVEFKAGDKTSSNDSRLTTPGALEVQRLLTAMQRAGAEYGIVESTSHGLELRRLEGCEYDVAVFTNLTPDHLDQHGTFEAYRDAKGRLFEMLGEPSGKSGPHYAVLNRDDPSFGYFCARSAAPVISYGVTSDAYVRATEIHLHPAASQFRVSGLGRDFIVRLPMPGLFNVSNALAAISVGLREGIGAGEITASLAAFPGVPGRMERIDSGQPFAVIVDYAHTGDALRKVMATLRPSTDGRIIAVFGSAGERGHSRRSGMAGTAADSADFTVLTDEDPRSEDPMSIIDEMAETMRNAGRQEPDDFARVVDRQEAIIVAMTRALPGDIVLIAGKGHEQSIEAKGQKIAWDDRVAARRALSMLGFNRIQPMT